MRARGCTARGRGPTTPEQHADIIDWFRKKFGMTEWGIYALAVAQDTMPKEPSHERYANNGWQVELDEMTDAGRNVKRRVEK